MRRTGIILAAIGGAARMLTACTAPLSYSSYSRPYVIFEAESRQQARGVMPATLERVDGESVLGLTHVVTPGPHTVQLIVAGSPGQAAQIRKSIEVQAEPCMRYYVGARRSSSSPEWEAFISESAPIKECTRS
jgi:hypothetical protein